MARRQTRPDYYNPYQLGGIGLLPRRGIYDREYYSSKDGVRRLAGIAPLRLLANLADTNPYISKAQTNTLRMTCAEADVTIVAREKKADEEGNKPTNEEATDRMHDLLESLPREIGGLAGLRNTLTLESLHTGLLCLEAVPGPRGTGIGRIWPVDGLTIAFGRPDVNASLTPYQRQFNVATRGKQSGYQVLDPTTFFWSAIDSKIDNPYGRPIFASALSLALAQIGFDQDLRDAVRNSAWKRLIYKYSRKALYEIAKGPLQLADKTSVEGVVTFPAQEFVDTYIDGIEKYLGDLLPDDNLIADGSDGGGVDTVDGANFSGMQNVINYFRQQLVIALDEMPSTLGITEGSTQTFSTVSWQQKALSLEWIRSLVVNLIIQVLNLHLRLLGFDCEAVAEYQPIRQVDVVNEANAEAVRTATREKWLGMGITDLDDVAMELTGSSAPKDAKPISTDPTSPQDNKADPTQDNKQGQGGGTTKDETQNETQP